MPRRPRHLQNCFMGRRLDCSPPQSTRIQLPSTQSQTILSEAPNSTLGLSDHSKLSRLFRIPHHINWNCHLNIRSTLHSMPSFSSLPLTMTPNYSLTVNMHGPHQFLKGRKTTR